jgi:hypothetical protein
MLRTTGTGALLLLGCSTAFVCCFTPHIPAEPPLSCTVSTSLTAARTNIFRKAATSNCNHNHSTTSEEYAASRSLSNRRRWIQKQTIAALSQVLLPNNGPSAASAAAAAAASSTSSGGGVERFPSRWPALRAELTRTTATLQTLLSNWQRAVVDCTYADVPRELLEQKNKELLLEKAATFALFDKSVSVTSCKTINNRVREYLGRTGIGPVAQLDGLLKQIVAFAVDDSDTDNSSTVDVDAIVQTVEDIQRELTRADSLSYAARRDFTSMNNFNPDEVDRVLDNATSNLAVCKAAIQTAVDLLNTLNSMLPLE